MPPNPPTVLGRFASSQTPQDFVPPPIWNSWLRPHRYKYEYRYVYKYKYEYKFKYKYKYKYTYKYRYRCKYKYKYKYRYKYLCTVRINGFTTKQMTTKTAVAAVHIYTSVIDAMNWPFELIESIAVIYHNYLWNFFFI